MEHDVGKLIRDRAYQLWVEEGRPNGRDFEHWSRATSELQQQWAARSLADVSKLSSDTTARSAKEIELADQYLSQVSRRHLKFLLAGKSGVGKSSMINSLLGQKLAEVNAFEACTKNITPFDYSVNGVNYVLYDTPGLCDELPEAGNDEKYLEMIADVGEIDSFFYVTKLNDERFLADEKRGVKLITKKFGPSLWEHSLIVFTHADAIVPDNFALQLNTRAAIVRREIGVYATASIAEKIPALAVSDKSLVLPNGDQWLAELYTVVLERIATRGALLFAASMAPRVKKKADALQHDNESYFLTTQASQGALQPARNDSVGDSSHSTSYFSPRPAQKSTKAQPPNASASSAGPNGGNVSIINTFITPTPPQAKRAEAAIKAAVEKDVEATVGARASRTVVSAAAGAAIGATLGPVGAVVGGVIGGLWGYFSGRKA
ncbi:MAG: 50S ribosome-binding GTPase [Rhodospirillales bacterium]|nr:50S ribosome-binding GTPase [Rhodospirillales bacterium]